MQELEKQKGSRLIQLWARAWTRSVLVLTIWRELTPSQSSPIIQWLIRFGTELYYDISNPAPWEPIPEEYCLLMRYLSTRSSHYSCLHKIVKVRDDIQKKTSKRDVTIINWKSWGHSSGNLNISYLTWGNLSRSTPSGGNFSSSNSSWSTFSNFSDDSSSWRSLAAVASVVLATSPRAISVEATLIVIASMMTASAGVTGATSVTGPEIASSPSEVLRISTSSSSSPWRGT